MKSLCLFMLHHQNHQTDLSNTEYVLTVQSHSHQANFYCVRAYSIPFCSYLICPTIPVFMLNTLYQSCCHIITVLGLPYLFTMLTTTTSTFNLSSRVVCFWILRHSWVIIWGSHINAAEDASPHGYYIISNGTRLPVFWRIIVLSKHQ
jgi:hypothetical protein